MEFLLPLLLTLPPAALSAIAVALMFSLVLIALFFMISYFFQNPQMIAFSREELASFVFTLFILFFWLSLDTTLNALIIGILQDSIGSTSKFLPTPTFSGTLVTSHIDLALASIGIFEHKLMDFYKDLFLFEALIGFLSTISFPLGSPLYPVNIVSFSIAPFTGLVLLSNAHTIIVEGIGYLITVLWVKEFILIFSRDAVPILLLPLGLVLRSFMFFRKTGSSILAVCFALYFVLPLIVLLSNYLIFDVYKPSDFTFTPSAATPMKTTLSQAEVEKNLEDSKKEGVEILKTFTAPDVASEVTKSPSEAQGSSAISRLLYSVQNLFKGAYEIAASFGASIAKIWNFMVGTSGDFFYTMFNNPLLPGSSSAGLFYFLIDEIITVSPFIILVTLSTVIEIIFTITAYRSISLFIGGEAELVGITKVV